MPSIHSGDLLEPLKDNPVGFQTSLWVWLNELKNVCNISCVICHNFICFYTHIFDFNFTHNHWAFYQDKTIYTQQHLLIMWCDSVGGAYSDSNMHFLFPWWQKYWPTSTLLVIFFRAQTATSSELQGNDLLCYCECMYPAVQISCPLNYLTLIFLWCIVIGPSRQIMYERCQ